MNKIEQFEWRCAYCGERFIVKSSSSNPKPPAGAMRICKCNPNGGRHMPVKVSASDSYEGNKIMRDHEWKCAYCGERFVVRSSNPNPPTPAGTMRKCKSNPNGGKHLPIKIV